MLTDDSRARYVFAMKSRCRREGVNIEEIVKSDGSFSLSRYKLSSSVTTTVIFYAARQFQQRTMDTVPREKASERERGRGGRRERTGEGRKVGGEERARGKGGARREKRAREGGRAEEGREVKERREGKGGRAREGGGARRVGGHQKCATEPERR